MRRACPVWWCSGTCGRGCLKANRPLEGLLFTAPFVPAATWWRQSQPTAKYGPGARTPFARQGTGTGVPELVGQLAPAVRVGLGGQGDEVGQLGHRRHVAAFGQSGEAEGIEGVAGK